MSVCQTGRRTSKHDENRAGKLVNRERESPIWDLKSYSFIVSLTEYIGVWALTWKTRRSRSSRKRDYCGRWSPTVSSLPSGNKMNKTQETCNFSMWVIGVARWAGVCAPEGCHCVTVGLAQAIAGHPDRSSSRLLIALPTGTHTALRYAKERQAWIDRL